MYGEDDHFHDAIARYTRSYRKPVPVGDVESPDPSGRPSFVHTPGELALLSRAVEVQELVILTHLFQERQYRQKYGGGGSGIGSGNVENAFVASSGFYA